MATPPRCHGEQDSSLPQSSTRAQLPRCACPARPSACKVIWKLVVPAAPLLLVSLLAVIACLFVLRSRCALRLKAQPLCAPCGSGGGLRPTLSLPFPVPRLANGTLPVELSPP